ncbi:Naphthoate synthase [Delftia sp. Cs1-4]|uniref:p-hydroxycinnamoyl CoA hydratase/lyase n=1 Tax=Delftia sp. (strain Cs1-4) TaxID=742013 RepID=UPI00020E797B|nr:p-hydroxycinnamoyl CoA hydratase/lyase [Delftia sp. Cs1-4]AEF88675.1 Naphthoate synthase [Delftia sp. Cs1-4]
MEKKTIEETSEALQFSTLQVERNVGGDGITVLTFNRPEKRNAMNPLLHREATAALAKLRYDDATRVVVITGAGKAFSAGNDLKEFGLDLQNKPQEYDEVLRLAVEWRGRTLRQFPKPTIAMVNGYCFGGAFSIVEACDLAFAATDAVFGLSEINFGMFPGGSVAKSMANLLSPRDALFYGLTGRSFDGAEAARIGLVNGAVPGADLAAHTLAVAGEIARKDPEALRAVKESYRFALGSEWDASISYTAAREGALMRLREANRTADISSFLEGKYKPGIEDSTTARSKE